MCALRSFEKCMLLFMNSMLCLILSVIQYILHIIHNSIVWQRTLTKQFCFMYIFLYIYVDKYVGKLPSLNWHSVSQIFIFWHQTDIVRFRAYSKWVPPPPHPLASHTPQDSGSYCIAHFIKVIIIYTFLNLHLRTQISFRSRAQVILSCSCAEDQILSKEMEQGKK